MDRRVRQLYCNQTLGEGSSAPAASSTPRDHAKSRKGMDTFVAWLATGKRAPAELQSRAIKRTW